MSALPIEWAVENDGSVCGETCPMSDATAILARSITRASSKQAYYTARLMVDKDLANDFYRAYAYFH